MKTSSALALLIFVRAAAAQFTLVTEPDQGLTPIYSLINSARHTIDVTIYELNDTIFEQQLVTQAGAGIAVRVILDQNLEKSNNQAAYVFLSLNGVDVHWANSSYAATHQKTIVIDGAYSSARAAILTSNLTPRYYSTDRDFALVTSDLNDIAAIETTFQSDFTDTPVAAPVGDHLVWSPDNSRAAILALIGSAQHTLQIENEEMSDAAVIHALVSAALGGVNVQITMSNTNSEYASAWNQLTNAGADVSVYAPSASPYIHAKVILADSASLFIGSQNFSTASLTRNRELGLIITDAPTISAVNTALTSDYLGGVPWPGSPPDFILFSNQTAITMEAGGSGTADITYAAFNQFRSPLALKVSGLPSGVTDSIDNSTLTLYASAIAAAGTTSVTVTATGGGLTRTIAIGLTVSRRRHSVCPAHAINSLTCAPTERERPPRS